MKRRYSKKEDRERNATTVTFGGRIRIHEIPTICICIILLVVVSLTSNVGCRSLFVHSTDGCYLDGSDATSDWERARSISAEEIVKETPTISRAPKSHYTTRGAAPYPYDRRFDSVGSTIVTSADMRPELPEKKSWSEKVRDAFRFPFFSWSDKALSHAEVESLPRDYSGQRAGGLEYGESRSETKSSSRLTESAGPEQGSFWSKLFPTRLPFGERSENEEIISRDSRFYGQRQDATIESRSRSKQVNGDGQRGLATDFFLKRHAPRVESWNRAENIIESYEQGRFLPSMKTIESYYTLESIEPAHRKSLYSNNYSHRECATPLENTPEMSRVISGQGTVEKTASIPSDLYRSSSYAPAPTVSSKAYPDELPLSPEYGRALPSSTQNSNTPLLPATAPVHVTPPHVLKSDVRQTSVALRSTIRDYPSSMSDTSDSGVASASFVDKSSEMDTDQESLLFSTEGMTGLSEQAESNEIVENADIDDEFRRSLGSQKSFNWFKPDSSTEMDSLSSTLSEPSPLEGSGKSDVYADDMFTEVVNSSDLTIPTTNEVSLSTEMTSAVIMDEEEVISDTDESMLETGFDSGKLIPRDALDDTSEYSSEINMASPLSEEKSVGFSNEAVELDRFVDGMFNETEHDNMPKSDVASHSFFSNSTVTGGVIASDLAKAIMDSVSTEESLVDQATALSEVVPETIEARKSNAVPSPLTEEEIAWIEQIKNAIQSLLREREEHKRRGDDVRICDARLRLLYLVIGEYERALQEIEDESDPLRHFWETECRGLETLLQNQLEEIDPTFVAERLRSGLDSFSEFCQLRIRKTLLVEAPACFGLFEARFDPYEPGEALYAYSELDYVTSRESDGHYTIDVECRWRLLRSDGSPLTPFETQRCSNVSESKLRDIVLNISAPLPEDIERGIYYLDLEVSDLNASNSNSCKQRLVIRVGDVDAPEAL